MCPSHGIEHWWESPCFTDSLAHLSGKLTEMILGNFHRDDAAKFLEGFGRIMGSGDCMFVGVDSCIRPDKV